MLVGGRSDGWVVRVGLKKVAGWWVLCVAVRIVGVGFRFIYSVGCRVGMGVGLRGKIWNRV